MDSHKINVPNHQPDINKPLDSLSLFDRCEVTLPQFFGATNRRFGFMPGTPPFFRMIFPFRLQFCKGIAALKPALIDH